MADCCIEKNPLVSVVMATHYGDSPAFLAQAVESILSQTHENLEFIIVLDGCIRPESYEYLISLGDKRVRLLELEKNIGPAGARNFGILYARGAFIAIMDADDISIRDRLKKQLAFIMERKADVVGSSYLEIDEEGQVIGEKNMPISYLSLKTYSLFFSPLNNPTIFARANVLKSNPYCEGLRFGEDYKLWLDLLAQGHLLLNMSEKILLYRKGNAFYSKRRGLKIAWSDCSNRMRALRIAAPHLMPAVLTFAVVSFIIRLLPGNIVTVAYRFRNHLVKLFTGQGKLSVR